MRYCLYLLLLCFCCSCADDLPPGALRIHLDKTIHAPGDAYKQRYFGIGDTAAWERTFAAADTLVRLEGGFVKLRSDRIWYEYHEDSTGFIRAEQHYPGWAFGLDSVGVAHNIAHSRTWNRMLAEVPAADVLLGPDSVRIGVVHLISKAFPWQSFARERADYLLLYPPGRDSLFLALDVQNVGPITPQTIFRIGRRHYALTSLSDDRRDMVIEAIPDPGDVPLAAEIDFNFRRVAVTDAAGNPTFIKREAGKELVLFFAAPHTFAERAVHRLDSVYNALPPQRREAVQIAVVVRNATGDYLQTAYGKDSLRIPLYLGNSRTCLRLNCRPYLPYYLHVDAGGRITSFYNHPDDLLDLLE